MRRIGLHLSISGGMYKALEEAKKLDINSVQVFLKNSNRGEAKEYSEKDVEEFKKLKSEMDISVFAHSGYLINLAGDGDNLTKSIKALKDEITRADIMGIEYIVIHPGSHKGKGVTLGIREIVSSFEKVFSDLPDSNATLLLETTAGQGNSVGHKFEHIADIIDLSKHKDRLMVCLDTCHIFAAGYDLCSIDAYNETMVEFDKIIGIDRLKLIHLNDSKTELGSKKDRHEQIGLGYIGEEGIGNILNDKRLFHVPVVLETPIVDDDSVMKNLNKVKSLIR
jgi:deoxyribonuclease IV